MASGKGFLSAGLGPTVYACRVWSVFNAVRLRSAARKEIALIAGVAVVCALVGSARAFDTFPGDQWVLQETVQWRTGWLSDAAIILSVVGEGGIGLGGTGIPWIAIIPVAALLGARRWADALVLSVSMAAGAANLGLKELAVRPRPEAAWALVEETGYSFPSGHAVFAAAFFGALAVLLGRWEWSARRPGLLWATRLVLVLAVICVGASRVYLGVHWPSDVIAGWLAGGLYVCILVAGLDRIKVGRQPDR